MDQDYRILKEKLTERSVSDIEKLSQIPDIRDSLKFKHSIALMVVLSYCPAEDVFFPYYCRLTTVFITITKADQCEEPNQVFERPIFRGNQGRVGAPGRNQSLCSWSQPNSVTVDIPASYQEGLISAFVYLLASDVNPHFVKFCQTLSVPATIEVPCLIEMFLGSEDNDRNNLGALISQYVALNAICFSENFIGEHYTYIYEEKKFDFCILGRDNKRKKVSVKSIHFSIVENFADPVAANKRSGIRHCLALPPGENILVHSCQCTHCSLSPSRKIILTKFMINAECGITLNELQCESRGELEKWVAEYLPDEFSTQQEDPSDTDSDDDGNDSSSSDTQSNSIVLYLVAARWQFELRYALYPFAQKDFRGPPAHRLRESIISRLSSEQSRTNPKHALIDRAIHGGTE